MSLGRLEGQLQLEILCLPQSLLCRGLLDPFGSHRFPMSNSPVYKTLKWSGDHPLFGKAMELENGWFVVILLVVKFIREGREHVYVMSDFHPSSQWLGGMYLKPQIAACNWGQGGPPAPSIA